MINLKNTPPYDLEALKEIMALLRSPEGCPWDREQTHQSIRRNMLEEAYEAVEAIDEDDPEHLKEELGDVLLQVVFHARMAQEAGRFTLDDVIDGVCQKLIYRHPHVFAGVESQDALATWDAQKRQEKGQRTTGDALDAVARALPALFRCGGGPSGGAGQRTGAAKGVRGVYPPVSGAGGPETGLIPPFSGGIEIYLEDVQKHLGGKIV